MSKYSSLASYLIKNRVESSYLGTELPIVINIFKPKRAEQRLLELH